MVLAGLSTPVFAKPAGMTADCNRLWNDYQSLGSPKAFATGTPNACGAEGPGGSTSLNAAKHLAIEACKKYGGTNCKVVDSRK